MKGPNAAPKVTSALPFDLVHQFVTEAAACVGPTPDGNSLGNLTGTQRGSVPQTGEGEGAENGL